MKRFRLIRHGETTWNQEGRLQGWAPASLNQRGRRQTEALATRLAEQASDVDHIYASDLPRVVETVDILKNAVYPDTPVSYDSEWRERDFGVFQGVLSAEFYEDYPDYVVSKRGEAAARETPEKGESYYEFRDRVLEQWDDLTASVDGDDVLVVTHNGVIRVIVAAIEGYDLVDAVEEVSMANASVTDIRYDCGEGEATIAAKNQVDHLRRRRA